MTKGMRVCSTPGCGNLVDGGGRCDEHRRAADRARGNRGYSSPGHRRFRRLVLKRDPVCVICNTSLATVADHYPLSRRDLIERGMNPNDPAAGRGVCKPCHDRATATTPGQRGGWNDPGWNSL